jgi:alpha-1,6-mannosyltransferase
MAGLTRDREHLARALASADALLHGSSAETFGLGVAEALCAGLPIIVPDAGGATELAGAAYAERYSAGDAASCALAIERMLAREPHALRAASRAAGEARVLSPHQHFDRLFATYAALVRPSKAAMRPDFAFGGDSA